MAGENVNSPLPTTLHQPSGLVPSVSAPSASQQQPLLQMPAASPSSLPLGASSVPPASANSAQMSAGSGVGGVAGQGHQQYAGPQQNSQGLQQGSSQALGNATGQSSNLQGQPINLQSLQQQPNSAGQLHAVNLTQGQSFGQNQQSLARNAPLNQMNYQQNQQQKQASGQRTQHGQYAQNQLNPANLQAQDLSQQAASAAMVQSPQGSHSVPRNASGQRLIQLQQATSMAGVRAATVGAQFGPGSLPTVPSVGGTALQQQQMLIAQRAAQGQGAITPQQRPMQSPQATQQNQQHSSMQSGQTGTQSVHQQATPSGIMGSSSSRTHYGAPYSQHMPQQWQQMGNLARPGLGGQATGHPSMLPVQGSPGLQTQLSSQPMQGRQKQGQVQASQFPASATGGPGMMGSITSIGGQLVRPGPHTAQQWVQQTQTRLPQHQPQPSQQHQQPIQQQQTQQLPQQPQSLTSPQKMQAQQLQRVPSVSSIGSGLQSSQSPAGSGTLPNQQQQQPWIQKQLHQQSSAATPYQLHHQQAAQQKQAQIQHSQQLQAQQTQMSQQTQQSTQQQQQGRVQTSAAQRPLTPTGVQPSTPASSTLTNLGGPLSQPSESGNRVLGKRSIQELVAQVDPNERLDPEVEDILLEIADDFIESVTTFACKLAKHRKSNVLEAKDVLLHLNRNWDINIPGFGGEEYHAYKRLSVSETHKQRIALVKKSIATQATGQDSLAGKASGGQPANANAGSQAPLIV